MKEFVALLVMALIFGISCMWLIGKDTEAWSERNKEPVFERMSAEELDREMKKFADELDQWGVVSDKTNHEFFTGTK